MRLLERVAAHARRRPGAVAARCGGRSLTYAALWAAARPPRARFVLHHGPKSLAAAALWLGCLRGRVPFVPLDPSWPAARARRARAQLARPGALKAGDAMVLFTSGSTGEPKGIPLSRAGLDYFLEWTGRLLGLGPADALPNLAPWGFDLSVLDVLGAWRAGASVELFQREAAFDPRGLAARLASEFTAVYATPSLYLHLDARGAFSSRLRGGSLRRLVYAGESYPPRALRRLHGRGAELFNFYGPTETNVCAYRRVSAADLKGAAVPIGKPPPRTRLALVDGELEVRGPGVMRGYLCGAPSRGVFRTGDRARRGKGGALVFLGRADRQVKLRGQRVEPGELEAVLERLPGVRRAFVLLGREGFTAHLHARAVTLARAKAFLARELPPYMTVSRVVLHPRGLPLTARGKLDAGRLKA